MSASSSTLAGSAVPGTLTPAQRQKERALTRGLVLDTGILALLVVSALLSGSVTMLAESLRGALLYSIEAVSLFTMRRSHRGKYIEFEYGIGKIERVITIIIAGGLFVSAIFAFQSSIDRIIHPSVLATPAMIFAIVVGSMNMTINFYCTGDFIRSNETEASLILESQVQMRTVKTIASVIVVIVVLIATWLPDPKAAAIVDAIGGFLAVGYMLWIGVGMMRESLPDLMDRALPENEQLLLLRVIAEHFDNFDQFDAIRSRRSGGKAFIDVNLEFDPDMPLREVHRRCEAIRDGIDKLIQDSIVTVTPRVARMDEASAPGHEPWS